MNSSARPFQLDRRGFLLALGVAAPAAALFASCSADSVVDVRAVGVDMGGADPAVRPQDDLYRHVNGAWLRDYRLPPDKASVGASSEADDRTLDQLRAIIENIHGPRPGSPEQQIRDLYDARLDLDEIERLGMSPMAELYAAIDGAATKAELAGVMAELPIDGLIGIGVGVDREDSRAYVASVGQAGLGLAEQYYRKPEFATQLAGYRTYFERVAAGAGLPDPAGTAARVVDLETRIAAAHWDNVRLRDTDATYNAMSWAELTALGPGFDWDRWLAGSTDRPRELFDRIVVGQPSYVSAAAALWNEVDIAVWRDYLKLRTTDVYARYLPTAIADARFDFVGRMLGGLTEKPQLWKSAVSVVDRSVGEQLGKLYVAKHFPEQAKRRAEEMVADLLTAYREDFTRSEWMSPATRAAAVAKLDEITVKIGYTDKWKDYSELTIVPGKLIESLRAVNRFEVRRAFARLGTPVDKAEWAMTPQTVNAYYSATNNEIVFPAAYLQPPYFDPMATAAVNYGAVGATIGHEIGHGFDDQGSKYDGEGNRRDWWTPEDLSAFQAMTARVVAQYDDLTPEGLDPAVYHVDGALTVGENLADLRGLQIALAAYRIAARRDGVEPDFREMFLAHARAWREKLTPENAVERLQDTHSPNEFRCNQVVRNTPEFYTAFGVVDSDKLYLPPDQRVEL
ncbi:M13 family metallopeptidase [Nocardia arizonensis]|uniref:M13 family metallopeptidase n=1 Tax=Nocardia arizonensis TaxID=1141647 RepID=UPI000ACE8F79|nr:M13 family metallopeptidase [Nocardia arizonensis]